MLENESTTEARLQAKGKNAPRVTPAEVDANIASIETLKHVTGSGQVLRWAILTTLSGYAVVGKPSASVSAENDDPETGEEVAFENSRNEMWPLMGFALKERLSFQAKVRELIAVQSHPDTLSAGEYMRGLANGMILVLAVSEGKEPEYIEPSKTALKEGRALKDLAGEELLERFNDLHRQYLAAGVEVQNRGGAELSGRPAHQQRVVDECAELADKIIKLAAFRTTPTFARLADEEQTRLTDQLDYMRQYCSILTQRIEAFTAA